MKNRKKKNSSHERASSREHERGESRTRARAVPLSERFQDKDVLEEEMAIHIHEEDEDDIVVRHKNRSTTYMSITGFSRELDIPKKDVRRIIESGEVPVRRTLKVKNDVKNLYRLKEFFAAFFADDGRKLKRDGPGRPRKERSLTKEEEDLRLTRARADKAEVELAERLGAVHLEEDIIREVGDMLGAFRARMLSVPTKAAGVVPPDQRAQVEAEIKKIVNEALSEISKYRPHKAKAEVSPAVNGHAEEDSE